MKFIQVPLRLSFFVIVLSVSCCFPGQLFGQEVIWKLGEADNNATDMALAPAGYEQFLHDDFGWEDRHFLIGHSDVKKDWPYVLPGPKDSWGGTGPTSGIRSHVLTVLFGIDSKPASENYKLIIDVVDNHKKFPPLVKVTLNSTSWKHRLKSGQLVSPILDSARNSKGYVIEIPVDNSVLKTGGNQLQLTSLDGGWLIFDQVRLEGPAGTSIKKYSDVYVRDVQAATYEISKQKGRYQPLLVDVEHIADVPTLVVKVDGKEIFSKKVETSRYQFEAPMPAVESSRESSYEILIDNLSIQKGKVTRTPQRLASAAQYVDTNMGTAHSRWMIAPGPWMPFSMVKISPDNQHSGWQAGYDPTIESVGAFSHIHEWTMAGLGMLPVNGPLKIKVGDDQHPGEGYRSPIEKESEEAPLGYYKVKLTDYDITAELTSTTRASFQRYTYPKGKDGRIMIDLQIPAEYRYELKSVELKKINDRTLEGFSSQLTPSAWGKDASQEYTIHFVIEFDQPIKSYGTWKNDSINGAVTLSGKELKNAGMFVEFDTQKSQVVQIRTGISYVSLENARENLQTEISKPFGWSFQAVRDSHTTAWNKLLERLTVTSDDRREKIRFYSNMYRALASRNIFSDVNGQWIDATEKVQQMKGNDVALGCDAFWNTFWNLNQFWNLVTPEWSSRWVKSQLAMYDANGWLAKGPAGMEFIPVMVAEHEIPLIVSAYQMGIRDYDAQKAFTAITKVQTTTAERVGGGLAGNADLAPYLEHKFVPYDKGRFSNSLEYSYDDYTVAQFAKALGKTDSYQAFKQRSDYWRNAIDKESGYARLRSSDGAWMKDFDPFKSGANNHYVEGNAWQLTFFVPQNVPALADMIGKDQFIKRLSWGFGESNKLRYNAPNDQYWDYPVIQGNQQSMHFAFLFNWVNQPWLTQQWSRSIVERYYGFGAANAYLGDEDQGQMSSWFIMAALGLFQTDGGTRTEPIYEIGSPLFEQVTIDLGRQYGRGKKFTIKANNTSRKNVYIQRATLNGTSLDQCWFPAKALLGGGELVLEMSDKPNEKWGIITPPVSE